MFRRPFASGTGRVPALLGLTAAALLLPTVACGGKSDKTTPASSQVTTSAPVITTNLLDQTVGAGSNVTFKIVATSDTAPTYKWYVNGAAVAGQTTDTFTLNAVTVADSGKRIKADVSNAAGTTTSREVFLTVNAVPPGIVVGVPALEFKGPDATGKTISLSDYKGKVVLVVFSTIWCGPCKAEAPQLEALYQKYKAQGFVILQGVFQNEGATPPSAADLKRWSDTYKLTFPIIDPGYTTANAYKIAAIPTNLIVDKAGIIRYREEGYDEAAVTAQVETLLKQ